MPKEKSDFEWESDPYAQKWIEGLAEKSKEVYKYGFNNWMIFIEMSPKAQIDKRIKDLQSTNPKVRNFFEDKVIEYKNRLETQGYYGKTLLNKTTPIRSFFTAHRVSLHFRRGELTGKKPKEKDILKFAPTNIEVRAMHNLANVRDRALLTFLYHTGFSPVDTLKQNVGDIIDAFKNEDEHFLIQTHRSKTGVAHVTCLSYEALFDLKAMMKERGLNVKEILENPEHPDRKQPLFITPKGERLNTRFLNDAMKRLAEKALTPDRAKQFKTKSLRDSYNVGLLEAEITGETKDVLFGHLRLDARGNYAFTEEIIKQAYLKAFKKLSINGFRQTKKQIAELEEKFDTSISALSETVTRQQKQLTEQKKEAETLKKDYKDLKEAFETFQEDLNKALQMRKLDIKVRPLRKGKEDKEITIVRVEKEES